MEKVNCNLRQQLEQVTEARVGLEKQKKRLKELLEIDLDERDELNNQFHIQMATVLKDLELSSSAKIKIYEDAARK